MEREGSLDFGRRSHAFWVASTPATFQSQWKSHVLSFLFLKRFVLLKKQNNESESESHSPGKRYELTYNDGIKGFTWLSFVTVDQGDDGLFEGCTQNNNLTNNSATATVLSNTRTPEDQSTFNPGCGRWNLHIIIWSMVQHSNNIPTLVHCLVFIGSTYSRLITIKLPICHPLCRGQYACAKYEVDQSMARWSACPWHMCILCRFCSTE